MSPMPHAVADSFMKDELLEFMLAIMLAKEVCKINFVNYKEKKIIDNQKYMFNFRRFDLLHPEFNNY